MSGCVDECLVKVGKILGSSKIVIGSVRKIEGSKQPYSKLELNLVTITARIVNVSTGQIDKSISYDSYSTVDNIITSGMKEVAIKLFGDSKDYIDFKKAKTQEETSKAGSECCELIISLFLLSLMTG